MTSPQTCPWCAAEQARLYRPGAPDDRPQITRPEAAADLAQTALGAADREQCIELALDSKHRLLAVTTVSIGSVDHTFMSPREIYRDALAHNAAAIVLAHNHPSGDPEPSCDDEAVTRRVARAGQLLDVELLDHLIVGSPGRWTSLARRGLL